MREWGWTTPVLVDEDGTIIAGHGRVLAARQLGLTEVPCMTAHGWTDAQKRAYIIADNKIAMNAEWDSEMLALELGELRDLKFDMNTIGFAPNELSSLFGDNDPEYSQKTDSVVYEPTGERPELYALVDRVRTNELSAKIDAASISEEEKEFMRLAAARHTVFDYHQIAEYYCHATAEMQALMEESALVIIDFDKAIEYGYVEMSKKIENIYTDSYGDSEATPDED
jgi:hypothetical protein